MTGFWVPWNVGFGPHHRSRRCSCWNCLDAC